MRVLAPSNATRSPHVTRSTSITGFQNDPTIDWLTNPGTTTTGGSSLRTSVNTSPRLNEAAVNASLLQRFRPYETNEDMNEYLTKFEQQLSLSPYVGSKFQLLWFNIGPKVQNQLSGYSFNGTDDDKFNGLIRILRDLNRTPVETNDELLAQFAALKQRPKEGGMAYYLRCRAIGEKLYSSVDSDAKCDMIKKRFREGIADDNTRMKFLLDDSHTVSEIVAYMNKVDEIRSGDARRQVRGASLTPNQPPPETFTPRETNAARRVSFNDRSGKFCNFCQRNGHEEVECRTKRGQLYRQ